MSLQNLGIEHVGRGGGWVGDFLCEIIASPQDQSARIKTTGAKKVQARSSQLEEGGD